MCSASPSPPAAIGAAFPGHLLLTVRGAATAFWTSATLVEARPVPTAAGILVCLYLIARGVGFLCFAVPAVSRHMFRFRTVEIHQVLPALKRWPSLGNEPCRTSSSP
ncbi:hypothetical protein [Streptomyces sp. NPDC058718]|uniref:hypothetical protein n=1 Tax=Streptomyces sp. NPDC058718 TaxID=3346610 RepID=UPI0036BA926B